jgi:hypothetical protein
MSEVIKNQDVEYNKLVLEFFKELMLDTLVEKKVLMMKELESRMSIVAANAMTACPGDVINFQDKYQAYQKLLQVITDH